VGKERRGVRTRNLYILVFYLLLYQEPCKDYLVGSVFLGFTRSDCFLETLGAMILHALNSNMDEKPHLSIRHLSNSVGDSVLLHEGLPAKLSFQKPSVEVERLNTWSPLPYLVVSPHVVTSLFYMLIHLLSIPGS
jgi:hypothetical protein